MDASETLSCLRLPTSTGASASVPLTRSATCPPTGASPARPTLAASRSLVLLQEPDGVAEAKLTWNTAIDAEGNTYYWNSAGASTYEQPADFDPATAKSSGVYQAKGNDGALYDDEVPEGQQVVYTSGEKKPTLSNTMRDKMIEK